MVSSPKEKAQEIIEGLEGTLIADLKAMKKWAEDYDDKKSEEPYKECGGLNYSLFLLCLIACETLGFYVKGACYHIKEQEKSDEKSDCCRNFPETGKYTMRFLQNYFDGKSYFNKLCKVLEAFLRNSLVHGFGSLSYPSQYTYPLELHLFTKKDPHEAIAEEKDNKKIIHLNGISFANQLIDAFEKKIKFAINEDLVSNILRAKSYIEGTKEYELAKGTINQFERVHDELKRKAKFNRRQ